MRGLGILNIKDLYGVTAIRERKRIDVVVRLVEWSKDTEYDRLGLDDRRHDILGRRRSAELMIPVRPGRDMSSILEVAARNELLKNAGHHAAREFFGNLEGALLGGTRAGAAMPRARRRVGGAPAHPREHPAAPSSGLAEPPAGPPRRGPAAPGIAARARARRGRRR